MIDQVFAPLKLRKGAGRSYENGLCLMEAVAWMNSECATAAPGCIVPTEAEAEALYRKSCAEPEYVRGLS